MFSWTSCLPPGPELDPEVDELRSLGFTGCLSSVLFNTVSPLKSALLHPEASSVTIRGPLTWSVCGSTAANLSAEETTHHLSGQTGELGIQSAAKAARFQLLSSFNIELLFFFFLCNFWHFYFFTVNTGHLDIFPVCLCAAGRSGSKGTGQTAVNALRRESVLIGGSANTTSIDAQYQ